MITTSVTLSDVKGMLVVDDAPGDRYGVEVEPGEFLVIEAGSLVGSPASRFAHPNIALTAKRIYHFKHYYPNGRKSWTSKAGVSFYLIVPRSAVQLLPEKGYSYIPGVINDVTVKFNVSGGTTNGGGWTDWLHTRTQISVGHCLRDLKRLAAVAVRGTPLEPIPGGEMDPDEARGWERLAAKQILRLAVGQTVMLEEGHTPQGPFTITRLRPLRGRTETGNIYRLSRQHLQAPTG